MWHDVTSNVWMIRSNCYSWELFNWINCNDRIILISKKNACRWKWITIFFFYHWIIIIRLFGKENACSMEICGHFWWMIIEMLLSLILNSFRVAFIDCHISCILFLRLCLNPKRQLKNVTIWPLFNSNDSPTVVFFHFDMIDKGKHATNKWNFVNMFPSKTNAM